MRDHSGIRFTGKDGVSVHLFFIDLANIDYSIGLLLDSIKKNKESSME